METYSSKAYRSFKTFIGELTAVAAGIYVGIQEAVPVVEEFDGPDPWSAAARKHDVIVHGLTSDVVKQSSVRLNVVSLYSGFDLFLSDVRASFFSLHGREWVQHDGDAPFQALSRNSPSKAGNTARLGPHRVAAMDHYRLVRNAIAHPSPEALAASAEFVKGNKTLLYEVRKEYGMRSAPNDLASLGFHDVKLLARVALDVAKAIDVDLDPGDERLALLVPTGPLDAVKSDARRQNKLVGWLRTEHGLSADRARRIVLGLGPSA